MNVKTDTKEKFWIIEPLEAVISANMAEELSALINDYAEKAPYNIILKMSAVEKADPKLSEMLMRLQSASYDKERSFVQCNLNPEVSKMLSEQDAIDLLNITPTESEAWDIVQMEEIERELLNGDD